MPINPQLLALLARKAGTGDVDQLATLLDKEVPGGPPTTIAPTPQPFPLPPRGGGALGAASGSGVLGSAGRPSPVPAVSQAAPQALAAASNQSALGGGVPGGGQGAGIGGLAQAALPIALSVLGGGGGGAGIGAALGGLFGGGAAGGAAGSSAGPALAGGLPDGSAGAAAGGINPLEALVPPTPGQQTPAPRAIAPRPGGQINPQILQLIMQSLRAGGGQPQQPQQSLGAILGQLR